MQAGTTQFGSGWAWLAVKNGAISVVKTGNAENPLITGAIPILTIDVWEHTYYIDYRNQTEAGFPIDSREMFWGQMKYISRNAKARGGEIVFVTGLGDGWQHPCSSEVDAAHAARGFRSISNPVIDGVIPPSGRVAGWSFGVDRRPVT